MPPPPDTRRIPENAGYEGDEDTDRRGARQRHKRPRKAASEGDEAEDQREPKRAKPVPKGETPLRAPKRPRDPQEGDQRPETKRQKPTPEKERHKRPRTSPDRTEREGIRRGEARRAPLRVITGQANARPPDPHMPPEPQRRPGEG